MSLIVKINKNILLIVAAAVLVLGGVGLYFLNYKYPGGALIQAPVDEANEETLDQEVAAHIQSKHNLIRVDSPRPLSVISTPLTISGEARGTWFFEGSFPFVIVDWDGLILYEDFLQAQGEWMTEDFVPFRKTIQFEKPTFGERGTIIFKKDNPSGLPENDDALEIPILFK